MKKIVVAVVFLITTLFAAQNANGQTDVKVNGKTVGRIEGNGPGETYEINSPRSSGNSTLDLSKEGVVLLPVVTGAGFVGAIIQSRGFENNKETYESQKSAEVNAQASRAINRGGGVPLPKKPVDIEAKCTECIEEGGKIESSEDGNFIVCMTPASFGTFNVRPIYDKRKNVPTNVKYSYIDMDAIAKAIRMAEIKKAYSSIPEKIIKIKEQIKEIDKQRNDENIDATKQEELNNAFNDMKAREAYVKSIKNRMDNAYKGIDKAKEKGNTCNKCEKALETAYGDLQTLMNI
jgi:hypothetical protein